MALKRYTVLNLCMRQGSYRIPQANHALTALVKKFTNGGMSEEASQSFKDWMNDSEIEVCLQGGGHSDLEALYSLLEKIPDIASAKFNESIESMNGACMSVTFVASDRIVAAGDYIRKNRLTPNNAVRELTQATAHDLGVVSPLSNVEASIASSVAFLSLA